MTQSNDEKLNQEPQKYYIFAYERYWEIDKDSYEDPTKTVAIKLDENTLILVTPEDYEASKKHIAIINEKYEEFERKINDKQMDDLVNSFIKKNENDIPQDMIDEFNEVNKFFKEHMNYKEKEK